MIKRDQRILHAFRHRKIGRVSHQQVKVGISHLLVFKVRSVFIRVVNLIYMLRNIDQQQKEKVWHQQHHSFTGI